MKRGWLKLYRKISEWEWSDDPNTLSLFVHILLSANFEEKKWHGYLIKRGELIFGLNSWKKKTGISIQSLRTSLSKLISTGEVTRKSTNKFSIISVKNWAKYQNKENNQQATNKQLTTPKECKEREEVIVANATEEKLPVKKTKMFTYEPVDDDGNKLDPSYKGKYKRVITDLPYDYAQELKKLRDAPEKMKMYKIIALFWSNKGWKFENRKQHELQLSRDVKAAKKLEGYSGSQIKIGIDYCKEKFDDWTLETVGRYLPELINKKDE